MGDRGNIVVREIAGTNRSDVWLYTHWHGTDMKDTLKEALAQKVRWDDASMLARIILCEMIHQAGGELGDELGFRISTYMGDNEHGILVVDVPSQRVVRMEETALITVNARGSTFTDKAEFDQYAYNRQKLDYYEEVFTRVLPQELDYRVSRTFAEYAKNGFKGPKPKKVERRFGVSDRRAATGELTLSLLLGVPDRGYGRRLNNGERRKK